MAGHLTKSAVADEALITRLRHARTLTQLSRALNEAYGFKDVRSLVARGMRRLAQDVGDAARKTGLFPSMLARAVSQATSFDALAMALDGLYDYSDKRRIYIDLDADELPEAERTAYICECLSGGDALDPSGYIKVNIVMSSRVDTRKH